MDVAAELRLDVAMRLFRCLGGKRVSLLPPALQFSAYQRRRAIQLLIAYDVHEAGGTARDIAHEIGSATPDSPDDAQWRDSAARRQATRLLQDAQARVNGGYLLFLRGK